MAHETSNCHSRRASTREPNGYGSSVTPRQSLANAKDARPTLLVAVIGSSVAFLDGTVVNVALPVMRRELALSVTGAQWVVEAYAFAAPGVQPRGSFARQTLTTRPRNKIAPVALSRTKKRNGRSIVS